MRERGSKGDKERDIESQRAADTDVERVRERKRECEKERW